MRRNVLFVLALRPLVERPLRTALALLGIACGTALYVAIAIINVATIDYFADSVSSLGGGANVSVSGDATGFPEETLERVEKVPGVDRVVPVVQARARAGKDQMQGVVVLGVDMLRESAVRKYETADANVLDDPLEFLNQVDSVLVTRAFADEHHLTIGAPLELTTASGPQRFVVRGILGATGAAKAFGGRVVFMDIDAARVSFGKEGRTDRLDVLAKKGADDATLARSIEKELGAPFYVERPSDQAEAFRKMIASYQAVLASLGQLSLVVAIFLVANTMAMNVSERRKEIGVLRAIGATRLLVLGSFLLMSAVIGVSGAALALPLGRGLASVLVGVVSRSVALTYATPIDVSALHLSGHIVTVALVAGLLAALAGGVVPAYRASTVPCVEALRPKDVDVAPRFELRVVLARLLGVLLLAYVALAMKLDIDWRAPWLHDSTLVVAYIGGALLAPWLSSLVLGMLKRIFARTKSPALHLALASLTSSPRRVMGGTTLSAALVLVLLLTTTQASVKHTVASTTERMLVADVWVSQKGMFLTGDDSEAMREDLANDLNRVPGVDIARFGGVRGLRTIKLRHADSSVLLKAWDRPPNDRAPIVMLEGEADALFDAAEPTVFISENFASHHQKRRGESLVLDTKAGPMTFAIAGVVVDFGSPAGTIYLSRETYKRLWRDSLVTVFYAYVEQGVDPKAVRDRIDQGIARRHGLVTSVTEDVRTLSQQVLDDAFAYTRAIEIAALVVGLLALVSTVLVGVLERKRELGMLRAIGMSARQLASMIAFEMAFLGVSSGVASLVLGGYMAHVWLGNAFAHDVGWPIDVHVPLLAVLGTLAAGGLVGIVAGGFGAERVRRIELAAALAYE